MKILITSGGTQVPIDSVRFIHNMSTGRFGSELAEEFLKGGHSIRLLHAKGAPTPFKLELDMERAISDYRVLLSYYDKISEKMRFMANSWSSTQTFGTYEFKTYNNYVANLQMMINNFKPDIIVLAAAVSDYGVDPVEGKMDSPNEVTLKLKKLDKVIDKVRAWAPDAYIVGFKLLVGSTPNELREAAEKQLARAKVDMVVGNDLNQIRDGNHELTVFYGNNHVYKITENQAANLALVIPNVKFNKEAYL